MGMSGVEDDSNEDLVREFLAESQENLDRLDRELLAIERGTASPEALASVFRTLHSIKGACGFFGFARLEGLAHAGEGLLARVRRQEGRSSPAVAGLLLRLVDATRARLAMVASTGSDTDGESDDELLARLAELTHEMRSIAPPAKVSTPPSAPARSPLDPTKAASPELSSVRVDAPNAADASSPPVPPSAPLSRSAGASPAQPSADEVDTLGTVTDGYVRLDVALLDRLMNLVGELVLARNEVLQHAARSADHDLLATSQRLNLITAELQSGVMKTRMQPIGSFWQKLPRLARDLARDCGKEVRLEMEGGETELDRTVLEAIKDPVVHLVRNAIDHGIENPRERRAAGKRPEGVLRLRAYHEGGVINIEVSDDGAGISPDRVRDRAIQRGLITRAQAQQMSDREFANLVFAPGFSTAERVTNVSGRGVGMDIVKTNVERIGGSLDLQNRVGLGVELRIKIPLTLAIVPALMVGCAGQRYAIPQVSLVELVRIEGDRANGAIETLFDVRVYRLRGEVLPVVRLREALAAGEGRGPSAPPDARTEPSALEMVIVQADDRRFGLIVDDVLEIQEIVVKPLERLLEGTSVYAGATILGDGKVALILDVLGLAQRANVVTERGVRGRVVATPAAEVRHEEEAEPMLLLALRDHCRVAIPLDQVARLEEFALDRIERAGGFDVVQYRGDILPLVHIADLLPERRRTRRRRVGDEDAPAQAQSLQVVVYSDAAGTVGFVVDRVIDAVTEVMAVRNVGVRDGVLGTVTLQGRVTELLDVPALLGVARRGAALARDAARRHPVGPRG